MRPGVAEGELLGGNLAVLTALLGTPYEPRWRDSVLFLEDIGENVYRIDRMLSQLKNAGILAQVRGIVLGSFTAIPDDTPNRDLMEVMGEYFLPLGVPVLAGFPFGHVSPKVTLPMGAGVRLDAGKKRLRFLHPIVG